jgi:hypothetical protein
MIESDFREWTLDKIDETFGLAFVDTLPSLSSLINFEYEIDEIEKLHLEKLSYNYRMFGGDYHNEAELMSKIISPLIVLSEIQNQSFSYFINRNLTVNIDDYELSGRVDGMIASGFRNPKKPYFCMNEYKKETDPNGDPKGQALIAMLSAQALNDDKNPIYGCYIVGRMWVFMALEEKKYAFSKSFTVDDDEIFDIYRILKSLKWHIEQRLK